LAVASRVAAAVAVQRTAHRPSIGQRAVALHAGAVLSRAVRAKRPSDATHGVRRVEDTLAERVAASAVARSGVARLGIDALLIRADPLPAHQAQRAKISARRAGDALAAIPVGIAAARRARLGVADRLPGGDGQAFLEQALFARGRAVDAIGRLTALGVGRARLTGSEGVAASGGAHARGRRSALLARARISRVAQRTRSYPIRRTRVGRRGVGESRIDLVSRGGIDFSGAAIAVVASFPAPPSTRTVELLDRTLPPHPPMPRAPATSAFAAQAHLLRMRVVRHPPRAVAALRCQSVGDPLWKHTTKQVGQDGCTLFLKHLANAPTKEHSHEKTLRARARPAFAISFSSRAAPPPLGEPRHPL
jgi:hypothetical protein